jgi:hypothetical protein
VSPVTVSSTSVQSAVFFKGRGQEKLTLPVSLTFRVVSWGCSLGSIGFPYLKAFGIRIHVVTFEKKFGDAVYDSGGAPGRSTRESVRSGDSTTKKSDTKGEHTSLETQLVLPIYINLSYLSFYPPKVLMKNS